MRNQQTVQLICIKCSTAIAPNTNQQYECNGCGNKYEIIENIPVIIEETESKFIEYYDSWYKDPHKKYNLEGIGQPLHESVFFKKYEYIFKKLLYTRYQRERFFKKVVNILPKNPYISILDIGCGAGNEAFKMFKNVYGVDYCRYAMSNGEFSIGYKMLIQADGTNLPFGDKQFDCVISSDVIGHIPPEKKEPLFSEISRVLKPNGITAHVIETDSTNFLRVFAKKHKDLYWKYFIDAIGGHFGVEMPDIVISRFKKVKLSPVIIKKYYSYVWDIEPFIALFNNEYKEKSKMLKMILFLYKIFCRNINIKIFATFMVGIISYIVDKIAPMSKSEGLLIICVKK